MWVRSSARITDPGRVCARSATWFAIVAVGRKTAASCPSSSAVRRWSSLTVGSSWNCSSPTSAPAIAASIALVGFVTVSERRSITARTLQALATVTGVDLTLLETTLRDRGERAYRAGQVWDWAARGASGYEAMTNLPRALRDELAASVPFSTLTVETERTSRDGTVKTLFTTADGHPVEAVLMRYRDGRRSLCLSSQSGCPLTCTFCATGTMRFGRNLTASEILDQALHFRRVEPVDHAVFMGMGEPLLNLDAVLEACQRLPAVGIVHRRTAISTVGWIPGIERMTREGPSVRLALSLHAADEALRSELMPVNDRYPLAEVLAACRGWSERRRLPVFVEYLMLDGVNDRYEQAVALARVLEPPQAF